MLVRLDASLYRSGMKRYCCDGYGPTLSDALGKEK